MGFVSFLDVPQTSFHPKESRVSRRSRPEMSSSSSYLKKKTRISSLGSIFFLSQIGRQCNVTIKIFRTVRANKYEPFNWSIETFHDVVRVIKRWDSIISFDCPFFFPSFSNDLTIEYLLSKVSRARKNGFDFLISNSFLLYMLWLIIFYKLGAIVDRLKPTETNWMCECLLWICVTLAHDDGQAANCATLATLKVLYRIRSSDAFRLRTILVSDPIATACIKRLTNSVYAGGSTRPSIGTTQCWWAKCDLVYLVKSSRIWSTPPLDQYLISSAFPFPFFLYRSLSNIRSSIPFQKNRITRFSNRRQPQWRSTQCLARVFVSLFRDHDDDVYINLTSSCVVKDGSFATWINYFASRYLDILCRVREFSFNLILSDEMAKKKKKNGKRSFFFFRVDKRLV